MPHQVDQAGLGSVAGPVKHRFTEKAPAQGDPVKPSHQPPILPDFHRMGITGLVQVNIGRDHLGHQPGAALAPIRSAGVNHGDEITVQAEPEPAAIEDSPQRPGHVQVPWKQHQARIRRPPKNRLARRVPGKDAVAVGQQKPLHRQIAADGEQSFGERLFHRRKPQALIKPKNRHSVLRPKPFAAVLEPFAPIPGLRYHSGD